MVSSGTVSSDLSSLTSSLSNYNSVLDELNGTWKGPSHDSISGKANEFSSSYSSTLSSQMQDFAEACSLYEEYENIKSNYNTSSDNYNKAVNNNDSANASTFQSDMQRFEQQMNAKKQEIISKLSSASSTKLEASPISGAVSGTGNVAVSGIGGGLTSTQLQSVLDAAEEQLGTPYHTMNYGPKGSGNDGFGCAMFVSYCYNQALFNGVSGQDWDTPGFYGSTYEYWGNVTNDGYDPHNKHFKEVSAEEAMPGDVVCYTTGDDPYASVESCGHVALYVGDGNVIGSWGSGTSGPGVIECPVEDQSLGGGIHYLRYVQTENV